MDKRKKQLSRSQILALDPQLDPEQRLCPNYDSTSITYQTVADSDHMGFRVLDNCAEEHAMS